MLDYNILSKKQVISKPSDFDGKNTVEYLDLLSSSFNKNSEPFGNPIVVEKEYVARPDLISLAAYGTDEYADIICKVNGISNPFEMNEGNVLIVPQVGYINKYLETHESPRLKGFVETEQQEIAHNTISEFVKKKNEKRLPNELVVGETNFVIDKSLGVVYY